MDLTDPDGHHLHLVEGDIGVFDEQVEDEEEEKVDDLKVSGGHKVSL